MTLYLYVLLVVTLTIDISTMIQQKKCGESPTTMTYRIT